MVKRISSKLQSIIARMLHVFTGPRMLSYQHDFQGNKIQKLRIGNTTFIDSPRNLHLKDFTYIGHFNFIEASNGIQVGKGCQITSYVSISSHSSHNSIRYYGSDYSKHSNLKGYVKGSIEIGDFTFVGPHVVIQAGTKIGKGSIVKAHAVVRGDFPDFSIIGGNPAVLQGSVSEKDQEFLRQNPELSASYMK